MNVTDSLPLISFAKSATESDSSSKYNLDETEEFMTFKIYENVESRRASILQIYIYILSIFYTRRVILKLKRVYLLLKNKSFFQSQNL